MDKNDHKLGSLGTNVPHECGCAADIRALRCTMENVEKLYCKWLCYKSYKTKKIKQLEEGYEIQEKRINQLELEIKKIKRGNFEDVHQSPRAVQCHLPSPVVPTNF